MGDLRNILEQIDGLTKALASGDKSNRWSELSREDRSALVMKLRASYLRMGNVLEEWNAARSQKERG